jgi:hypothetical protein
MSISLNNLTPTADCATAGVALGWGSSGYNNGPNSDGVGATYGQLSGSYTSSLTIDGISVGIGTIVLIKDESISSPNNQPYNGLYVCTQVGNGSTLGFVFTRHVNMSTSISFNYSIIAVSRGTTNANSLWMFQYLSGFVVGNTGGTGNAVFASLGVAGMNKTIQQLTASGSNLPWNISLGYNAYYKPTSGSSVTITFSNLPTSSIGVYGTLVVTQPASGTAASLYVSTTPASIVVGGGTPSATPGLLQLSTINSAVDIVSFYYDGTTMYWTYAPNFKT